MWKVVEVVQFQDKHITLRCKLYEVLHEQLEIKTRNKNFFHIVKPKQ